jgi:choline monooxygenase
MLTNLAARYYADPAVYEAERQAIFRRTWQLLGPASRLARPGDYQAVDIAGWHLFALRGDDGVLRAFHNVCRHRGARLVAEGAGVCKVLRCPYHNWVYAGDGALRHAPWFGEDPGFDPAQWPLQPAHLAQWRGLVFIAIDPAADLVDQLGDLPAELADDPIETYLPVEQHRFDARTNWKTYTDNFVEGYHIPGIHPGFMKTIDFARFETVALNGLVRMTAPQRDGSFYGGTWLWMWPNWTLSTFPGGMNISRINPVAIDATVITYDFLFADRSDAAAQTRRRTIDGTCAIVREDFGICETTQRNYLSGAYRPGPLSPRHEQSVAYFQAMVAQAVAGFLPHGV